MIKRNTGFSLVELMVVIGIIVCFAMPRYRAHVVRGYRAEARVNLKQIASLQEIYRSLHNKYTDMPTVGYAGGGVTNCSDTHLNNALGFTPTECVNTRYGYIVTGDATQFTAVAYAPSDTDEPGSTAIVTVRVQPSMAKRKAMCSLPRTTSMCVFAATSSSIAPTQLPVSNIASELWHATNTPYLCLTLFYIFIHQHYVEELSWH